MMTPKDSEIIAASMAVGLCDYGIDKVNMVWGEGFIELVIELTQYASFAHQLCDLASAYCDGEFPGVFDYEVSEPFGSWFGASIVDNEGEAPSEAACKDYLRANVAGFFSGTDDILFARLHDYLEGATA